MNRSSRCGPSFFGGEIQKGPHPTFNHNTNSISSSLSIKEGSLVIAVNMSARAPPSWRQNNTREPSRQQPRSTIPSKRRADDEEEAWIADEDRFVLRQAKKKAAIRVKGGRARPIDWLTVTLRIIDPSKELDNEEDEEDLDIVDPEGIFEGLGEAELVDLEKDIESYLALETNRSNKDFWEASDRCYSGAIGG